MDNELGKFEVAIDDFKERVQEIAANSKNIESFSDFCVWLHKNIEWKIKHGNSNMYTEFLWQLVCSNKEFAGSKKLLIFVKDFSSSFCCCIVLAKMILSCNF